MYTSGQFTAIFRVSKKLLRHYNEIGLLMPSEIDSTNGYYYYGETELELMKQIMYLRALQMQLPEIKKMVNLPKRQWHDGIHQHLSFIREQQRGLVRIVAELEFLEEQILNGGLVNNLEKKTEYKIRIINLEKDILVTGCGVRVKHGSPEHMPAIQGLIENYFGDDVPAIIPNRSVSVMRFSICAEFTPETGEFTYMMGDQVTEAASGGAIPDTLRSHLIAAGDYACVTFSAPDVETLTTQQLMPGYDKLFGWLSNSEEWESSDMGVACEVYEDKRFEVASWPEMAIWTPVKRKDA